MKQIRMIRIEANHREKELTHHIDRRHPDLKVAVHHHRGEQGQV